MLLIDIGNTRLKWGIWQDHRLRGTGAEVYRAERIDEQMTQWFSCMDRVDAISVCSVASAALNKSVKTWFERNFGKSPVFVQAETERLGLVNGYQEPLRLGADRWLSMLSAYVKRHKALCVIACGSAITLDIVAADGCHQGGLIMPGLAMMRKALFENAAGIDARTGSFTPLATNTADAVYSGCLQLVADGLSQQVCRHEQTLGCDLQCVITGGDGETVARQMTCECVYEADLVLKGLGLVSG